MTLQQKIHHSNQIANAIQRHEDSYRFDTEPYPTHVLLPTPQVCGTSIQRRSYAMDKAMNLIEKYSQT